jgi:hypothetical protein
VVREAGHGSTPIVPEAQEAKVGTLLESKSLKPGQYSETPFQNNNNKKSMVRDIDTLAIKKHCI